MSRIDLAVLREKTRKRHCAHCAHCVACSRVIVSPFYSHKHNGSRCMACGRGVCVSVWFTISLLYLLNIELGESSRSSWLYSPLYNSRLCYAFFFRLTMPCISFLPRTKLLLFIFTFPFIYFLRLFLPFSSSFLILVCFWNNFILYWLFHALTVIYFC